VASQRYHGAAHDGSSATSVGDDVNGFTFAERLRAGALDGACLYRRHGPLQGTQRIGVRLLRLLYAPHDDLVIRKELSEVEGPAPDGPFRLEPAGPQHVPLAATFYARRCYRRAAPSFAARLERGYSGLVALLGGEMVGYFWYVDGAMPDHPEVARYDIPLSDDGVYGFDLFLAEEHRGGGKATAFLGQVHRALRDSGYQTLWGYVESGNMASRWLFSIAGHSVVRRRRASRILSRLVIVDRKLYLEGSRGPRPLRAS
jgi:hypothetical protein